MPRLGGLGFDEITISELQALNSTTPQHATPATFIEMSAKPGQPSYRLVWLRMPNGNTQLFKLIPDPLPAIKPQESTP